MADVTDRDRERAAVALNYGPSETVSPMDQEYVDQIAAALAEEREKAQAPYEEAIDAVLAYCNEMDQADFFPGLADTDAIRTRLATVDVTE